jgi:hypothetical protein
MARLGRISAVFVLLFAGGCSEECSRDLKAYSFEEPGPWGEAAADVFGHTETVSSGTVMWIGLASEGAIEPDMVETDMTLEVTLDRDSAAGVGDKLGTCDGRFEIDGTLTIVTADGALDESIPIVLVGSGGLNSVSARVDLTGYDFAGTLELGPAWAGSEMQLVLIWDDGGEGLLGMIQSNPEGPSDLYAVIKA